MLIYQIVSSKKSIETKNEQTIHKLTNKHFKIQSRRQRYSRKTVEREITGEIGGKMNLSMQSEHRNQDPTAFSQKMQ